MSDTKREPMTVTFRSDAEYYELERSGRKPCTVRLLSPASDERIGAAAGDRITIVSGFNQERSFTRTLTSVVECGELLGKAVVCYSWHPDEKDPA